MKKFLMLTAAVLVAAPAFAQDTKAPAPVAAPVAEEFVSQAERLKIETVVKELFQREPGIVMEAAQKFQMQQQEEQMKKASAGIKDSAAALYNDKNSPVTGNPKGDVTVVEFFDYNCGYCKKAYPTVKQLIAEDKNVRVVSKQYPILGPTSLTGAQAAMAANLQGKFAEFHDALMSSKDHVSDDMIMKLAAGIKGLDVAKLKTDMAGDEVKKRIDADMALGQKIGVNGTPGFVIADKLIPGAMGIEDFKKAVADARAQAPAKK